MLKLLVILLLNIVREKKVVWCKYKQDNELSEYYRTLENIACLNGLLNRSVILDKFIVYSQ